jgi:hypothetical protein
MKAAWRQRHGLKDGTKCNPEAADVYPGIAMDGGEPEEFVELFIAFDGK